MQPDISTGALGRYQLLARIASGGMGVVHVARARGEHGFSRTVALKQLHPHLAEDPDVVERFLAEARIASQIVHPHVVSVLDVGSAAGRAFLVLDYVHGESLAGLLRASAELGERPPLAVVSAVVSEALEGLHAAHETVDARGIPIGLVHRDVSPHNVLVSTRGAAYVTDFGVAKVKDALRQTRSGSLVGKAGYMAPEQLGAGGGVTRATDIYGAGVVLWESLTGERLFDGLEQQIEATAKKTPPPPPSSRRTDIPPLLDELVLSLLALSPNARPRTALDAARALTAIVTPASAREVGEWVLDLAGPKLDRLDAAMREATLLEPTAPPSDFAQTIAEPVALPAPGTATRWRRRAHLSMSAAIFAVVLAIAVSGGSIWAALRRTSPAAASPSAVLTSPPRDPPSGEPEASPETSSAPVAEPTPPPAREDAGLAKARAGAAHGKPRATPRIDCHPPYVVEGGIKRYKRECFPGGAPRGR